MAEARPVYLNLFRIRLPVTGVVSLAHRVSGVLLFLSLPFCVWLLERSVSGQDGFDQVLALLNTAPVKLLTLLLVWSLAHHFFAGIRFLLLDFDVGIEKPQSRLGAWLVVVAEVVCVLAVAGVMLWA